MAQPSEHSSLGPSSWPRWVRCPGSVKAQEDLPDRVGYEAAEGTVFHELVASCLEFGFQPKDFVGPGNGMNVDGFRVEYDDDMVLSAQEGIDFVLSMAALPGWRLYVEVRVDISKFTLPGQFGTADVILVNPSDRKMIVFDWKYGKEPVYPHENYQLQGYCLGAWQTIAGPMFDFDPHGIDVTLIIEQPRVPGAGGSWTTTMSRVLEFGEYVKHQAVLSQRPDAPKNPGFSQCRWCRARNVCGEHANWHMEMLGLEFDDLDSAVLSGVDPVLSDPEEITPERRTVLLKMTPVIHRWLDALHNSAYHDSRLGNPVPGMKMVAGRKPPRKYLENAKHKAQTILMRELGDDAYVPRSVISPAQAEKKLGKPRYVEVLDRFVDRGVPRPILVPEEDRRQKLDTSVDMLDDLD